MSSICGMMACNLLATSLSHRFCHKDEIKGWIFIKTSVHGSSKFWGCAFDKASFAARSASSFPLISLWLGSQQNVINLPLDNIFWHACTTLFTRGFLLSWLSMACNTDMLSENITKLGNHDICVTPVNRRTALWVFVEIDSISMRFWDNMNDELRYFILRNGTQYGVTWHSVASRYADFLRYLRHVIRWYLGTTCFKWILMYDKMVLSRN